MVKTKKTAVARKKTIRRDAKKRNSVKASVLAVTLIILGIGVAIGLSSALLSIRERRMSIGEGSSSRAFQNAESGVEKIQKQIQETIINHGVSTEIKDFVSDLGASFSCDGSFNFASSSGYVFELQRSDGTKINCDASSTVPLSDVIYIKSIGESGANQRAVKATLFCADADIVSDLVGHWDISVGGETDDSAFPDNDLILCDGVGDPAECGLVPYGSGQDPTFENDGGRRFIRFNEGAKRNYAVIPNESGNAYMISEGTLSFWYRFHGAIDALPAATSVISRDQNSCDIRGNMPPDALCGAGPVTGEDTCDCGHFVYAYNWMEPGKMSIRFQNDANGSHYKIVDTVSPDVPSDGVWRLFTLAFSSEGYFLWINAEDSGNKITPGAWDAVNLDNDPDALEGWLGNDLDIFLGRLYNPSTVYDPSDKDGNPSPARVDLDDIRIYDRAFNDCDVVKLYNDTK